MGLFVTKKGNITRINRKDDYYRDYYFNKRLSKGIELVALIENISKKDAAELLMSAGLSKHMGSLIKKQIELDKIAREQKQKVQLTQFAMILKRYAKENGIDISKFI
jgi:hypothetical protein